MDTFKNPLETVQLIPIFNYLNILSDFLFTEGYLPEIDQNKQIPIVNALYDYLQQHEKNKIKKEEIIRTLLKGSDLYGEKDDEYFDETFANAMIDYIISSLVFDKYGNIYGFLADIFVKVENLQIDEVLQLIISNLENASFENEYGDNSVLSILSTNRIYSDIILPLFPRPNANISLLSLDYIYAQAGLMFLRPGRINTIYYSDFKRNVSKLTEDNNLFDEYLVTGHVIEKLILDERNFSMLRAFALPALLYYIFNSKYLFVYEKMEHVISDSEFWQSAYKELFQFTAKASNGTEIMMKNDYTLKMHFALSAFQTSTALAKTFMEIHCPHLNEKQRIFQLPTYLMNPKSFKCQFNKSLPDVKEYVKNQIDDIIKMYEMYDLQLVQEAFPKYLKEKLEHAEVIIKLLILDNTDEHDIFSESERLPYDFLEFYFPNDMTFDLYILIRGDYNVSLISQVYNPELFVEATKMHFEQLLSSATIRVLKTANENITVFFQNFIKYKTTRLQSYLEMLDNHFGKSPKSDWWKEFGLSLVPCYPCLSNPAGKNCRNISAAKVQFFDKCQDGPSRVINTNTRTFFSSVGTTIRSVLLKNASYETVDEIVTNRQEYNFSIQNVINNSSIFEIIGQHVNDPAFPLTFATKHEINVFEKIIDSLKVKTDFNLTTVVNSLLKISILKSSYYRSVSTIGKNRSRLIFVNTLNNKSDTGYGYKFIFLSDDISRTAQLRTDHEFKVERLLSPILDSPKNAKKYLVLNSENFQTQYDYVLYEINNQFRKRPTKVTFSGIPIQADDCDEKCSDIDYFKRSINFDRCQRRRRFSEKLNYEEDAVKFVRKNTILSEKEIRNTLEKYTFPGNTTLTQFVNYWLQNLKDNNWSKNYMIDNPKLLNKLRYELRFESGSISGYDGIIRINYLYTQAERIRIEEDVSIISIIDDYNEQKAKYSVTWHDYYAIRNFATTGYTRITRDTQEAKLMKTALYKLAIRQSDDPDGEFDWKLFRVESKPISVFGITSSKQHIILKKFTTAFPSVESAVRFAGYPAPGFMNIVYEMVFHGPYVRAKIEQFYKKKEKNVILLPGSEFLIAGAERVNIGGLGRVLKLTLNYQHSFDDKYIWYKKIMNEMARIQF